MTRLLDGMDYIPSVNTDVQKTWERFGFVPVTDEERRERQKRRQETWTTETCGSKPKSY